MAYPTIHDFRSSHLNSAIGDLVNIDAPDAKNPLTFTKNSGKYVFTNYPEGLGIEDPAFPGIDEKRKNMAFTDNGHFINFVNLPAGEHHIFYSHNNLLKEPIRYGVLVQNISAGYVQVTRVKAAYSSYWPSVTPMCEFLKGGDTADGTMRTLAPYGLWVINQPRDSTLGDHGVGPNPGKDGRPFHGIIRIHTTGLTRVICYAYRQLGGYTGHEKPFPRDPELATGFKCASGIAEGYILNTTMNLEIGGNLRPDRPYIFRTSSEENENDLALIVRVGSGRFHPLGDTGNYTAEYRFTVNIKNSTDTAQTVYGFISSQSGRPCIQSGQDVKGYEIGKNLDPHLAEAYPPTDVEAEAETCTWRWFEETIPANSTQTFTYTLANGSYGNAELIHAFSLHRGLV